jgi:hypothetical protein
VIATVALFILIGVMRIGQQLGEIFPLLLTVIGLAAISWSWFASSRVEQVLWGAGLLACGFGCALFGIAGLYWQAALAFLVLIAWVGFPILIRELQAIGEDPVSRARRALSEWQDRRGRATRQE